MPTTELEALQWIYAALISSDGVAQDGLAYKALETLNIISVALGGVLLLAGIAAACQFHQVVLFATRNKKWFGAVAFVMGLSSSSAFAAGWDLPLGPTFADDVQFDPITDAAGVVTWGCYLDVGGGVRDGYFVSIGCGGASAYYDPTLGGSVGDRESQDPFDILVRIAAAYSEKYGDGMGGTMYDHTVGGTFTFRLELEGLSAGARAALTKAWMTGSGDCWETTHAYDCGLFGDYFEMFGGGDIDSCAGGWTPPVGGAGDDGSGPGGGTDTDDDGTPDDTDTDDDNDTVPDGMDPCPLDPDCDDDGVPDDDDPCPSDSDCDDDGVPDDDDPCPEDSDCDDDGIPDDDDPDPEDPDNPSGDCDMDEIPNGTDPDDDNDGTPDAEDPDDCDPDVPGDPPADCDEDEIPDSEDTDDDNDGVLDVDDPDDCDPEIPGPPADCDDDGTPDAEDTDDDNDGVLDVDDSDDCDPEVGDEDADDDGIPDDEDDDDDGDGIPDDEDCAFCSECFTAVFGRIDTYRDLFLPELFAAGAGDAPGTAEDGGFLDDNWWSILIDWQNIPGGYFDGVGATEVDFLLAEIRHGTTGGSPPSSIVWGTTVFQLCRKVCYLACCLALAFAGWFHFVKLFRSPFNG